MPGKLLAALLPLLSLLAGAISSVRAEESEPRLLQLYQYKPIYFIMGRPDTKIQLSFKVPLIRDIPVYFGYTQLMMWELFIPSPYFSDLNYDPEVFYRLPVQGERDKWLDLSPFEHESNGMGGMRERSWNRVYLRYHTCTRLGAKTTLLWNFKAWVPIYYNPNNRDLAQYRGIWEIEVDLSRFLGPFFGDNDLIFRFYPGGTSLTNPLRGGQELTFRARKAGTGFLPLLVAQVFHGYGEDLLRYNQNILGIRAGIGF